MKLSLPSVVPRVSRGKPAQMTFEHSMLRTAPMRPLRTNSTAVRKRPLNSERTCGRPRMITPDGSAEKCAVSLVAAKRLTVMCARDNGTFSAANAATMSAYCSASSFAPPTRPDVSTR